MCGITGILSTTPTSSEYIKTITGKIKHRGPDAVGYFQNEENNVFLGHRRLAIIDLSEEANQPMSSHCGRYVSVFNGEIYNYQEIARKHQLHTKTTSDTEVLVEGFAKTGAQILHELNGMFAFAVWDKTEQSLFLARDRVGIKPLYYYLDDHFFVFASELKAITAFEPIRDKLTINQKAIQTFLHIGYIPAPFSIYNEVKKIMPGQSAVVKEGRLTLKKYWDVEAHIQATPHSDYQQSKKELKTLLESSVSHRLMADVPFGTFLSGGIDSSLVTAIAQQHQSTPINTFSIGFKESSHDESVYAEKIAKYLGTHHHTFTATYDDVFDLVDSYMDTYDEPFADSSGFPTMLVSKLARQHVTMTLSGDGGDEQFMGYGAYAWARRLHSLPYKMGALPMRFLLSKGKSRHKRISRLLESVSSTHLKSHIFSQEQYFFTRNEIHPLLISPENEWHNLHETFSGLSRKLLPEEEQALFDIHYYLPEDLLTKVDRASMRYSLETRVPLLDHRIIEYSLNIPLSYKIKQKTTKYILKDVLFEYVPAAYFDRPKWGFSIPLNKWLKKELSYLINNYLSTQAIESVGVFHPEVVQDIVQQFHTKNGEYLYKRIWLMIVLQKWFINQHAG